MPGMRRWDFVSLLGGTAATWPLAARAQRRQRRWLDSSTVDRPTAPRTKQPTFIMGCIKSAMSKTECNDRVSLGRRWPHQTRK